MENENKSNQDCGCGGTDCCTPGKSKLWMKIIFIAIVVAAIAIVTVKLVSSNNNSEPKKGSAVTTENSGFNDSATTIKCAKACDPSKNPSCCPQTKK
jgi:hypothetical protein